MKIECLEQANSRNAAIPAGHTKGAEHTVFPQRTGVLAIHNPFLMMNLTVRHQ
jgi:hypothetical protein